MTRAVHPQTTQNHPRVPVLTVLTVLTVRVARRRRGRRRVLGGLAVQPGLPDRVASPRMAPVNDHENWFEDTPAEQLRQDQCLMADVLRLGGPAMTAIAQDGLNQPQDKLRALADRQYWEKTPLAAAYDKDRQSASKELDALNALWDKWKKPLDGLETPAASPSPASTGRRARRVTGRRTSTARRG